MTNSQRHILDRMIDKALCPFKDMADSDAHLMTLFAIALSIKAQNILELGVREGHTTEPLVLAASLTGGHVVSVDKMDLKLTFPDALRPHHQFICLDSIDFLTRYQGKKFDLVFIDDWHSYGHVKREIELVGKLTDANSIILLHDLMPGTEPKYCYTQPPFFGAEWADGGPYRAVSELGAEWEWATIPVNNGLTLLRKKA